MDLVMGKFKGMRNEARGWTELYRRVGVEPRNVFNGQMNRTVRQYSAL
jgi:hypothetical protein